MNSYVNMFLLKKLLFPVELIQIRELRTPEF